MFASLRGQDAEHQAQQMLRFGLRLMAEGNYTEAVKELSFVADSFAATPSGPVAVLRLAEYYFEVKRDLNAAERYLAQLTTDHRASDSAAMGYVLLARLKLMRRGEAGLNEALGDLRRAQDYFQHHPDVAAARYHEAELLRLYGNARDAAEVYRSVALAYPTQAWAARSRLGEARCLVALGRGAEALVPLQWVRDHFPDSVEAADALNWNALVHRLYLRQGPLYRYLGQDVPSPPGKLKGIKALAAGVGGALHAGGSEGLSQVDAKTGKAAPTPSDRPVRAFLFDSGNLRWVKDSAIAGKAEPALVLRVRKGNDKEEVLDDLRAAVRTSRGELLVADGGQGAVLRFSRDGEYLERVDRKAERLAIDSRDALAVLTTDDRSVTVLGNGGRPVGRPTVAGGFKRPVDIAYDALGHLYVLDRGHGGLFVFSPANLGVPLAQFVLGQKVPGAFLDATAFAIDAAGGLYIYDADAERIQVYR